MPWVIQNDRESVELVTNILARSKAHLLTGYFDDRYPKLYNAAILFTPRAGIAGVYRKIHLVPFGEYVPLRSIWAPLLKRVGPKDYNVDDFFDMSTGTDYTIFEADGFRFGSVICYEDTVPGLYRGYVQRDVDFMVNLTNDAWFKTSPELEMHLANAVFRAVENRRPLVRATNNGVTCVVGERGFIRSRCLPFVQGSLSCELSLPADRAQTFYTRHGDVFVAACVAIAVLGIGLAAFRDNRLQSPRMTWLIFAGSAVASYFLGSIPTGFLWAKSRGIDIRKVGSGNIGATNVMRTLGKGPGIAVLAIDALKGFLPVWVAPRVFSNVDGLWLQITCCVFVIAGHNWTCWLKFKGGKGVATSAGALLAFLPLPMLCGLGVWLVVFGIWRYVSLASISAAVAVPLATWLLRSDPRLLMFTVLVSALAIYKHKSNIRRLLAGTENRIGKPKPESGGGAVA